MDFRFTFDDVRSSRPQSVAASSKIAKLTASISRLKADREIVAVTNPSSVGKLDHQISRQERLLRQLASGVGARRRK